MPLVPAASIQFGVHRGAEGASCAAGLALPPDSQEAPVVSVICQLLTEGSSETSARTLHLSVCSTQGRLVSSYNRGFHHTTVIKTS